MAKKKKESLSRTLAEVSKGVTKTVANDKSVSAKVRKQAKSDYRKASRISNSSASKNYISNSRLRRTGGSSGTSANSASMANRMRGESASQRNAGGNTIREIARSNTPKKNSVSRTYSELQNKTKDMNLTDTAVGRGMARAGLTAKGTAKEAYGGIKTAFSAIRDPNEERNIKADQLRKQRGEQTKGNKYEGAYDKLRNAQRDNREQREKDLKSASKMLESASADKQKAKEGLGKAGKFALDVESALLGMAGDAAVGAVTGTGQVGALGSMFVRSFGGGYDLAKREGASDSQAALYAAVTGGKEVLTEKMFNVGKAFSGVFGKGLGDDVINKAAEKGAEKLAKKFGSEGAKNVILHGSNYLASALTEGLEEVASTASDPFIANAIYARAVGNPHSFDAGDTFYDFLVGAALGGLGGGIAEASNYSQGGQVKNVLGKDGLKEVADRVAYADEDSGISDSAKAISQMILNGEDVANAQALKLYKAAEAQEQKNFTQYRDAIKGATSIIERDNLISPSGLTVDESGQVIPSIGDNTNIKFQESRTEARKEAEKLQLKDDVAASIGDTIASIKTGIGVVDDIETIVRYPEAKAVYESVTGETLPSGRKALREYLYKKNAENRVQSAREETEFWKDQAVGLLSQTETEDFGGNGQAVFTKATENLDVNELGNSALTKVRTTINDYYNSAKLGIPFSTLNDIAKPEYEAVSEDIKREAYNAGILDSNDIYKYLDGIAVNKDESIKSSANKENRNANPGKLYVDADNAARKYFTNSQQKLWKTLAEEFSVGIHIMDAESFADALRAKGQNEVADSESLPNGFYDNGEIYLNVETPDRATRYVFMHEFTHFLEQTAPKEYSELRKRMIDALIEDGSLERRLSRKRMQYGEGISQDDLIDEILADSTYEFLNDKDFANGIARESENLAQAIINAIRNLIRKIRNVLARDEYTPTQNANMYAQLGVLKDMEALWLDAVNAAKENARVGETTDSARFSLTDNNGNALSEGQQVYFKNSKVRDEDGNLMVMYHGTMNAGFTVFDKSKANVEGNSGAGFYFSNQKADSLENYSDHTGADNEIKIEFLAEQIMEMGEWNDVEIDTYEEARNIAIKELERNPGMYEVYINITKPYIRAFDNSTNIYTDIEDSVDDSLVEREDYDTEEEYFDDLYNSRNEQIYDKIDRAFYGALQEVESRYGEIEFSGQYADAIYGIYSEATDYGRLNFTDIYQALQGYSPSVYNDENGMQLDCTSELTRQFIEEFGYDGIIDKEVSHKFGKMNSMDGAIHAIAFNPEQAKLTINDKPTTNPDIRFSLKGKAKEEIENLGVAQTESGSVVRYSLKSWSDTDKAKLRKRLKEAGFKRREIDKWIEDVNGISEIIALDRERLDYTAAENQTMLKHNDDYYRSLDASTLCAKRILYQGTYNAIQKALPNTPLLVDDVVRIRQMLDENGLESPCGICYVESRRKTLGKYSSEWLESYKGEYIPTLADVTTTDGLEALRREHPKTYDDYMKAMRKKGVANPKVVELRTDYRGEIDKLQKPTIEKIIRIGGLRIQSFSDFETPHLIDMMQAVLDMAAKGLTAQAYTKVPNFAWAFGDTGIKINLSLIAKKDKDGNLVYDEDGRLMFDSKEGMPIEEALKLRERYPENVGTIVVGISEEHIKAAMADDRIDMIIPFHRSGWGKAEFEGLGLTGYEDFQAEQEEYLIHPYETGKMKNGKPEIQRKPVDGGFYSNDYWDFKKSGKENAEIYLKKCADTGRYPVFKSFLKDNGDGSFSLQEDGSTDGYWKMLIDFKMYDNNGKGVKQKEVTPNFNMAECRRILSEYEGGADTLPVADEVVDAFIKEYKEKNPDIKFSLLDNYTVDNNGELVHLDKGLSARPQRARYTEERIDDILETYGSDSEKYAQAYITSMSPRTFLKLTLSDEKRSEWERAEKEGTRTDEIFPLDTEQLKNESQTPFLKIDSESGEVLSHEGRHRMLAMYNAGIRNVPVVVIDNKTKYSKTITPSMTLLSQDFGEGNVNYGYKVSVTNLIPTNKVYKDKIMEAYGNKAAIKFSRKDSEGNELSDGQIDFFADSKARDEDGDLLVGYHGTSQGGFNTFDISREKPGFFTTSKRDADSYGGNDVIGKMYNPSETESDRAYITKTATIKDILDNPNSFNINDIKAAYDSYDLDNPFIEMRREYEWEYDDFIDSMREFVNSATEEEKQMYLNTEFSTSSDVGEKTTRYNNRMTYSAYFNINNPMIVDLKQRNAEDGRFYELLERAKANKNYDGFICRNVKLGRYHDNGTVICPFYPEQVKDTGNLNPTKDTDIRFSQKEVPTDEEVYEYMASHPEIYKEMWSFDEADKNYIKHKQNTYAELETKVEQLKQNQKKTYGKVLDEKSVRPAMNELVKSILQASEQGRGVKKTDNKMVNDCVANAKKIFTAYKNSDTELMITTSLNAAESMVESLKFIDDSMYVYYKDLRGYLKTVPIKVDDTIKGDIPDYNMWRKSQFGKLRISDNGVPVDEVYAELCEMFPEMFSTDIANPTDQILRMAESVEEIQPYAVFLSSEEYDNLVRQTAGDLIDITVKGRAYKSMADRYEERIKAVKQRAVEAKRDAQEKKNEAVRKEREKAAEKIEAEKQKRKDSEAKLRADRDAKVKAEKDKRKEADKRRKEAYKRRKSMKMLTEDYKWLSDRILKPTDDKHVPDRMVQPLAELLQYIDLETEYSKKFEEKTGQPTGVAVNLRNLRTALEDVSKSSEANWILEDEDLPQMIEELQKRIEGAAIYELDNSELDAVQALLHAIRVDVSNANKAFVASRSIDDTAKAVIWEANEYATNSKKRRSGGIVNQLLNESMVKPMEFFEHLGPTMKSVYMGLRRGMDVQSNRMKETRAFFAEVFEGYGKKGKPGSEVQKWRNEKTLQEFELQSGEKISLNTAQIMSLHCLSKRKQAMGHICGQGICASEIRDFGAIRSTIGDKEAHKKSTTMVTETDVMNIISTLTDEQAKMADKLQDYLNTTVAEWGNETSLLMYDRKKFTEENYFPIKTQDVYLDANFEKRQRNIESIKNFGFTKGTVVNANNPIVIDDIFAVVAKHVNQMILYNAYAPAISDFTRVYNYREVEGNQVESVQAILADTYGGKIIDQYISKFMSDLQSNTQTRRGGYERVANILLANYKKAAIGASPRVALQQPTAIVRALSEIDAKYFVKMEHSPQLLQMATKKDNALKEMLEHCPIAYWKSMGFNQVDMARDIEDIMMNMEWSRLDVLTMSIYGALDTYTWSKIWKAIKAEQKDLHPEVEYESDEFWELCNERAIEVFDKTQVVDSVFHRSDVMRSDNLLIKSITSFMSEPTTTFNMLRSNLMRANDLRVQGKGKEAFKLTRRTLNVYIANAFACAMAAAIADAILKKQTGDDDDEENKSFIEFWLANTIVNFKNNVSPLNLMPITRDFSSFADGWGTKNMFEEGIALVIEDAVAIKDKATDPSSTKKTWEELITELAKDSSYLTGIPVKNFMRYGAGILDFLGINAFAAEKDSEGGQSKSLFGEILEMAGFSNGDDSANSQSQSLEAQYEESWLTKKLHEAGITEGTRLDNVLNFFGLNKSIEEQKEEHYQDMLSAAKAAGKGYVGVERDEKIYSKATDGYTKLAEAGEFEELARIRRVLVELDVDTTNFDERVESHIKTGIKKQIGEKGDSKLRNRLLNQLKEVYGYTDEQISTDVLAKTDTATAFQKALCEDNYDEAVKQLRYLRQAGLTYETFLDLYEKRWKVIDAKTTGTFSWPAQGRISSGFGQRWGTLHAGIDIAMPTGTEVVASDGGEVVYTGYNSAMGNYVDIKHSNGYVTRYQHLSSYGVLKGEKVKKGQYIASSGNTGNSTGPHLHFAVYRSTSHSGCSHSTAVDPSIFLKSS